MRESEILFDAITNVREELVEEAQAYTFRRRGAWRRYAPYLAVAACLALVVSLSWGSLWRMAGSDSQLAEDLWNGSDAPQQGMDDADGAPPPQDPETGETSGHPYPPDSADQGDSGDAPDAASAWAQAIVLEVQEDALLVEVLSGDGGLRSMTFLLPVADMTAAPGIAVGDTVDVSWSGEIDWDSEPPVLLGPILVETVQPGN